MYKIGEFSKIVDIPIRTLRFYDSCGVLQPKKIDDFTGYRYYTEENIRECKLIKLLKSVNFTLEEIMLYKNNLDLDILIKKEKEILEQIEFLKRILQRLSVMKEELEVVCENNFSKLGNESNEDRVLRRTYERKNIKKIV